MQGERWCARQDSNLHCALSERAASCRFGLLAQNWCLRRESNTRPIAYRAIALPVELRRRAGCVTRTRGLRVTRAVLFPLS
jgi:hypothetical protein